MKIENIITHEAQTMLTKVSTYQIDNECKSIIVTLHTPEHCYTNYQSVWDRQGINLDEVESGAPIKITYIEHTSKNGRVFRNFVKVTLA